RDRCAGAHPPCRPTPRRTAAPAERGAPPPAAARHHARGAATGAPAHTHHADPHRVAPPHLPNGVRHHPTPRDTTREVPRPVRRRTPTMPTHTASHRRTCWAGCATTPRCAAARTE